MKLYFISLFRPRTNLTKLKTLKSSKKRVTNRKQAIAIALSEAAHLKKKGK